ncbi:MAG: hypothetical protein KGJ66_01175 [Alphaproteobacteria bacterium]|nr:hypothetical protein [Alphaproteobacteria bacterium]
MARDRDAVEIIHRRAFQVTVVEQEAARFDDIDGDPEARAEAQDGARVLRNVGLVEGQPHVGTLGTDTSPWQVLRAARQLGF